jgi:hypothetical protein
LRPVLEAGIGPAIALAPRDNELQDLVVAFPLDESAAGFTGRVAFLIFWANWFEYVRRSREPLPRGAVSTRETVNVKPLAGRGDFTFAAAGSEQRDTGTPGRAMQFDTIGVYNFDGLDTDLPSIGVSLLDADESDISKSEAAAYDASVTQAWMRDFEGEGERRDLELRPWLALLAIALLLFDWFWFRRKFPTRAEPAPVQPKTTVERAQTRAVRRNTSRVLP